MDVELSNTIGPDSISVCFLPGSSFQDFNNARAWHQEMKPSVAGAVDLIETATVCTGHKCSFPSARENPVMPGPSIPHREAISWADAEGQYPHPLPSALQIGFEHQCAICNRFPLLNSSFPPRLHSSSHVAVCCGNCGDMLWELLSWRDDNDEFPHGCAEKHVPEHATSQQLPSTWAQAFHSCWGCSHVTSCGQRLLSTPSALSSL